MKAYLDSVTQTEMSCGSLFCLHPQTEDTGCLLVHLHFLRLHPEPDDGDLEHSCHGQRHTPGYAAG